MYFHFCLRIRKSLWAKCSSPEIVRKLVYRPSALFFGWNSLLFELGMNYPNIFIRNSYHFEISLYLSPNRSEPVKLNGTNHSRRKIKIGNELSTLTPIFAYFSTGPFLSIFLNESFSILVPLWSFVEEDFMKVLVYLVYIFWKYDLLYQ